MDKEARKKSEVKMKRDFCPNCEEYTEAILRVEKEVYNVRGEPTEIEAEIAICQECGNKIFDEERDSRNLEKAYSQYRQMHKLLSLDEIRTIFEIQTKLRELGYLKPPKGEPPLLRDEAIRDYLCDTRGTPCSDFCDGFFYGANYARKTQREADIKWIGGQK